MPAPTVTAVSPTSGLSRGGSLVTLTGTNFDLTVGNVVTVTFDGLAATDVRILSATQATCLPPAALMTDADVARVVDIVLANVDLGGPNSGTLAAAYTYRRPNLLSESHLLSCELALLKLLKQQVLVNTAQHTHADYDATTADLQNRVEIAKLPAIQLIGPTLLPFTIINRNDRTLVLAGAGPDAFAKYDPPHPVNVDYDIRLVAVLKGQLLNLLQHVVAFFARNQLLEVPKDPLNLGAGVVVYPLLLTTEFRSEERPSRANILSTVASVRIEGVLMESGDLLEAGPTVDTTPISSEQIP